ncbi:DMT family transporter [Varunaivibrio sulfuroxidans]|uniref:EamA domain-containing membrane protein RarD n=1 Tax=Varunaivibrio sulfuroxidans TaxID=1773489 RepID=A0A4R3J9K1_9PROT|nr:DMT family transporter [Varunaivibrio sulfuroxidans]TCS62174.1 EamA domain-containing membrane protein RarD [Varunaivibrio sulfuroxidans]WES30601.1 DMT family transporter [Varunaivibrio sulfuroxidans]
MSDAGDRSRESRAHLLCFLATMVVATSFPVGAAITQGLDSLLIALLRFSLATALLAPFVAWRYGLRFPGFAALARYGAISLFFVVFFWGMFAALRYTSALNTAAIFTLLPTFTAVASFILLKDRLNALAMTALAVGMGGAMWVVFRGDGAAFLALNLNRGDVIFLLATISMGLYGALVKHLYRGEPMAQMTFWTLLCGAAWLLVLSLPRLHGVVWTAVPFPVYAGIVYLGISTVITFFSFQWSATVIGPTKVMSYSYLNPALVLLIGLGLGHAAPWGALWPGLLMTLGATVILQRARPRRSPRRVEAG